ncbi:iron uptake protein [Rubrivivax gelatinosus]|uniref:iron uptake protein n=1 Tax=Rubrivivax gelatinosus TaxID=28068 RepID=UPI00190338A9|nr:iron uptake protein [Rubrivivax gelatinosus]MBK1615515.1 iron uptake protein [Rubrivivax gelatinosus]
MAATLASPSRLQIASRVLAAVVGGYAFCWGLTAFGLAGLYAAGMAFHDAEHLSAMLAVLAYLGVFLWAVAARSQVRVWAVLLAGGAAMAGAGSLIQFALVA